MNRIQGNHRSLVKKDCALLSYISTSRMLYIRKLDLGSVSPVKMFTCFFTLEVIFDLVPVWDTWWTKSQWGRSLSFHQRKLWAESVINLCSYWFINSYFDCTHIEELKRTYLIPGTSCYLARVSPRNGSYHAGLEGLGMCLGWGEGRLILLTLFWWRKLWNAY